MTRFASFWVEGGKIRAPLNVMRFDDTAYRILGENLESLTRERDLVPDGDTYGQRSTGSMRTPGALVRDFALTL
jgi:predicted Zn-dependent protease